MPTYKCTHKENCNKVCVICFRRARLKINAKCEAGIRLLFVEDFEVGDLRFPQAICSRCQTGLYLCFKMDFSQLPKVGNMI